MSVEANLKNLFSLEGKVVLITGAAGGIGAELAKGMAGVGASIANCDVDEKRL
ncbi:MAG: SDR family NAD(P)-dependent oxidoreductase, partial [Bacillota bacterium]